jgi:hypothetical protein
MPKRAEQTRPKMNRLNFRVNRSASDDLGQETDLLSIWLKAIAIAILAIGMVVVGTMLSDSDANAYLRVIAIRW